MTKTKNKYTLSYVVIDKSDRSRFCMADIYAYTEKQARFFVYKKHHPNSVVDITILSTVSGKENNDNKNFQQLSLF